ncbi:PIG-L deacetylase family protein [Pseudonocardia kunmingensis]|uniref:GlcNAc-PI de-N-acetylase n=1 Tax=Pseudonocardia kunmingensis TaxID=630975 RepID=A0A543DKI2_9PSEU|nr:PIG-L family deacetylase [Pseudonocardia kunmingensis]TQM09837.1 GlcNAc-PI de-N-acetylase [Pseudonocardia kunmingensis]
MTGTGSVLLDDARSDGSPVLFLSAHLDDAVLSCGALIEALRPTCPVTVATLFTAATCPPHTLAARSFLRQCSSADAAVLFAARQAEDEDVLREMEAEHVHFGETDALFRRRSGSRLGSRVGRLLPELAHRYPTYRYDIAKGRVARGDRAMIDALVARVSGLIERTAARVVFAPVGVGRHVDHLITRSVAVRQPIGAVYYSDFPYNLALGPDQAFLDRHDLRPWTWQRGIAAKQGLIRRYRTQVDALFPSGEIAEVPELYYEPAAMRAA